MWPRPEPWPSLPTSSILRRLPFLIEVRSSEYMVSASGSDHESRAQFGQGHVGGSFAANCEAMQVALNRIGQLLRCSLAVSCVRWCRCTDVRVSRLLQGERKVGAASCAQRVKRVTPPPDNAYSIAQSNATQCYSKQAFPEHYHGAAEHALADALALAIAEALQVHAPMQERPPDDGGRNTCFE